MVESLKGKEFASHGKVNHGKDEYVRGEIHSNTAEGFFAILKRGVCGTFHHVPEAHVKRYLAEFKLPLLAPLSAGRHGRDAHQRSLARDRPEEPDLSAG